MIQQVVSGAVVAALVQQVASFPTLYDTRHGKCEIPDKGYKAHGAPVENPDISMEVLRILQGGTETVTQFVPGETYTLEIRLEDSSAQSTNMWVHASDGIADTHDTFTDAQATTCEQAAFSLVPKPLHNFIWTAPQSTDCVNISVAMSGGASQAYKTSQMSLCAEPGATPVPSTVNEFNSETEDANAGVSTIAAKAETNAETVADAKSSSRTKLRNIVAIVAGSAAALILVLVVVAVFAFREVCRRRNERILQLKESQTRHLEKHGDHDIESKPTAFTASNHSRTESSHRVSSKLLPDGSTQSSADVHLYYNALSDHIPKADGSAVSDMYAAAYPTRGFTVESSIGGTVEHPGLQSMAVTASSNISKRMEFAQYQIDSLRGQEVLDGLVMDMSVHSRLLGGQAVIQFAKQRESTLEYAIKFYLSKAAFGEEAALYTDSNSPLGKFLPVVRNIVSNEDGDFKDASGTPMPPCICMEKGESLDIWMRRTQDGVDMITGLQVIYHIAARLQDLHDAGYCHRDLKPGNVMWLPRQNRWTLIDFGCAAIIGETTRMGYSLAYAAPEVIHAVRANSETVVASDKLDAWSLGVMAVELLSNKTPFNLLEGSAKVMDKIAGVTPLPWEDPNTAPSLLRKFGHFKLPVLSLLDRDPAKRPSMDQFLKQCNRVLMNTTRNEGGGSPVSQDYDI